MVTKSTAANSDAAMNDLGPLAWVFNELCKSLDAASKAFKRFTKNADAGLDSDLSAIDIAPLRTARQQFHQAVGALEVVGLSKPALLLHAMEAAVQKFVQHPELCSQDAVAKIEYASFALTEYLQGVLADKPFSAVSLFPQYRNVQELVQADRIHPADLWSYDWRWLEPQVSPIPEARLYDDGARSTLDQLILQLIKGRAPQAAGSLKDLCQRFALAQTESQPKIFWLIAAGFFEAIAHNLIDSDLYVRRAASRVLLQFASLSKGDLEISECLSRDLLFFCVQAVSSRSSDTPVLSAVRLAYGLARFKPVDYELIQFGRFDPALLAQARKRILLAKDGWSLLCAGDSTKIKQVADQFSLVVDSLRKLHSASEPLAEALSEAIEATLRKNQAPAIPLAMEVATSVLYLDAVFDDLDPADSQLLVRTTNLAERLQGVIHGGEPQPLATWMEELYRRVSDKQTMSSVVTELRVSLAELEHGLDAFFRNPNDKTGLQRVPGQLSQIRGVLSVLGLEDACKAVVHMKSSAEQMLSTEFNEKRGFADGAFEHLGNNLGVLSFLIDMLNYQPALVKKLFAYDEEKDELTSLMGRPPGVTDAASSITVNIDALFPALEFSIGGVEKSTIHEVPGNALDAVPAVGTVIPFLTALEVSENANDPIFGLFAEAQELPDEFSSAQPAPATLVSAPVLDDLEDGDLRDIFLEEAREVAADAVQAMARLQSQPDDLEQLTVLRRAFHTLKGSARMVGLNEFGEASWAMEQLLNSWLVEQKTATAEFRALCNYVLAGLIRWIDDIAGNRDSSWLAAGFCNSARIMQNDGRYLEAELLPLTEPSAVQPLPHVGSNLEVAAISELGELNSDSLYADSFESRVAVADSVSPADLLPAMMRLEAAAGTAADSGGNTPEKEEENEEAVKFIDGLRIGIPLYNVYLNEADEWSRRLGNEVAEWALERHQSISASTVALAHSLAGSSATVGFVALSELARALEHALDHG